MKAISAMSHPPPCERNVNKNDRRPPNGSMRSKLATWVRILSGLYGGNLLAKAFMLDLSDEMTDNR